MIPRLLQECEGGKIYVTSYMWTSGGGEVCACISHSIELKESISNSRVENKEMLIVYGTGLGSKLGSISCLVTS